MKRKSIFLVFTLVSIFNSFSFAQNSSYVDYSVLTLLKQFYETERKGKLVMQDNELEPNSTAGYMSNIYVNPLLLDGKQLIYGKFDLLSKGILSVVKGNPETSDAKAIPFYVSIRRNGKIIESPKMKFKGKKLYKIDVSEIFPFCENGDLLILKPANPEDWRAKRILKLLGYGC